MSITFVADNSYFAISESENISGQKSCQKHMTEMRRFFQPRSPHATFQVSAFILKK